VMFTTAIAARAIMEFKQLMTGFMGDDRTATEVLERLHESEVRTNSGPGEGDVIVPHLLNAERATNSASLGLPGELVPCPNEAALGD
jgi:hypothetical protein